MRETSIFGLALALYVASPASAAPYVGGNGTLAIVLGSLGGPTLTGSGAVVSNGFGTPIALPAGFLGMTGTISIAVTPPALNLSKISVMGPVQNGAGTVPGLMGNNAIANLFFTSGAQAGAVPLAYVGDIGTQMVLVTGLPITIIGAAWTDLGVTSNGDVNTIMLMEVAAGIPMTITASAYDHRGASGAGTVQLVAPVNARIFGGALGNLPIIGILTLQFIPEPGTLLLVGAGVAGLVAHARRRRS